MKQPDHFIPGPEALVQLADRFDHYPIFAVAQDGIQLLDPRSKEPIQPNTVPLTVNSDLHLGRGLDYLEQRGQSGDLRVDLVLSPHRSARDFTATLLSSTTLLETTQVVAVNSRSKNTRSPYTPESLMLQVAPGYRGFQHNQRMWLTQRNKQVLPCQYDTSPRNFGVLPVILNNLGIEFSKASLLDTQKYGYEAPTMLQNALRLSHDTLRQWAWLGRLGALLLENQFATGTQHTEVSYLVELRQSAIADKLASLGVTTEVHLATNYTKLSEAETAYHAIHGDMTRQGKASFTQLKMPLPL